ncbi:MAG: glycosyltransferase [Pseudomonadales bacterium]
MIQVVECFAYGTAKSVKQLSDFLKADFDVEVFYCDRDGTEEELKNIDSDIKWTALRSTGPLRHINNIRQIRSKIDDQCQAVHGHSSYGGMYARLASLGKPVPNVFFSPRGYAFLREDMFWAKRAVFLFTEFVLSFFGTTVSCGPSEYKTGGQFSRRIVNVNNSVVVQDGCDIDDSGDFTVLSIGRIAPQKGFDLFLKVASRLPETRFTWVGSCDDDYYDKILETMHGLPRNVEVIGYMDQHQLFNKMREQTIIMHTSRWEGLSRVLLEALALGKPLVTSTFAANLDCLQPAPKPVEKGRYANGFACTSVDQYVSAIRKMKADKTTLAAMAQASYALARNEFDVSVIRQQWLDLYKRSRSA